MNAPGIAWFENKVAVATSISVGGTMTINVMIVEKKQNNILSTDQLGDLKTACKNKKEETGLGLSNELTKSAVI